MDRDAAAAVEGTQDEQRPSSSAESMQQPGLPPQQQYLYSHNGAAQQQAEGYRGNSGAQAAALPPLHSSFAEGQTAMQPHYLATTISGTQLQQPPYNPAAHQYALYHQNGAVQPPPMPSNGQGMMRYPIPPQTSLDSRQMTGARGKKDIKRRTKTGCLTCRKRRIKCDEAQPSCRNCAKSKRECLGYDPIFKQQSGPANIQPAPVSADSPESKPATTSTAPSFRPPPYPEPANTFDSPGDYQGPPSYTSLDPSLGHENSFGMARSNYHNSLPAERKVIYVAIDDLFSLNDTPPQYQQRESPPPLSPSQQQELADFYMFHYATGLDRLLETTFYTSEGLTHLQSKPELQDFVYQCAEQFKTSVEHPGLSNQMRSLEARLVWHLIIMGRSNRLVPELTMRVETLENLLTGHFLDPNRILSAPTSDLPEDVYKEQAFWHNLARFVAVRDDRPDATTHRQIDDTLGAMRGILGMMENRDVLYSIAIARHIGGRSPDFHPQRHIVATSNDADDEVNKLKVAHQFVEIEDQKGTTQVIQRVCSMALRAWALQKQ